MPISKLGFEETIFQLFHFIKYTEFLYFLFLPYFISNVFKGGGRKQCM